MVQKGLAEYCAAALKAKHRRFETPVISPFGLTTITAYSQALTNYTRKII
jgi:hypothetical protein